MGLQGNPAVFDTDALLRPGVRAFLGERHRLLIDGVFVDAASGATFESFDPATGRKIADVAHAGAEDVDRAVRAAARALEGSWARLLPAEREAVLRRFAALVEGHADDLAQIEALDSGKPASQIKAVDIALGVGALSYNAGWVTKIEGRTLPVSVPDMHVYTRREPVGVVAAIVPWNFPLCQACFKLAPALAAGCTVVLKPAEQTPLSALYLGRLALEAGLPPGVLNVLPGFGATTGQALISHPGVAKIAFTGSERTGKHIARSAADSLKHVSLELGGKNPNVIFADADVEAAAAVAAIAIFFYSGQVCAAGSRLMVERPIYDRVVETVIAEAGKLKLGHGLSGDTFMGPLVSAQQLQRVSGFVSRAAESGVRVAQAGTAPQGALAGGFFHAPTVLVDADDTAEVTREEIFGPVLVVQPFDTLGELKARANATSFGLSAGVWTRDVKKAHATAAALQAGTVWINTYGQFDATAPWGGFKQSGYGRDNGAESLEKYLQTKTVWTALA
ncbi:aldehyde dehydrogenase family protein [Xanthobacter autotrophicus DSM 431]|uniref:aldehyde dehydrogenase family protein n=1 Tax=Xanthobacter TaxID=279 RepID=UPI00372B837D